MSGILGSGTLDLERRALALALLRGGMKQKAVAAQLGVSKNTIAGIWARSGDPMPFASLAPTTLSDRCDALVARMELVLAETRGVGVIREPVKSPSTRVRPE